ncbi:MAG TPA: hypothetical protein VLI54_04000 [Bacillota bacterium]|nr:hypothetical protein [Bacillota bacterium]
MSHKKKLIFIAVASLLFVAAITTYVAAKNKNNCPYIACASGDKCVAPNDAIVKCEDLERNPTKTDW